MNIINMEAWVSNKIWPYQTCCLFTKQ